jgi:probable rRNA maturation factor
MIEINNLTAFSINKKYLEKLALNILKKESGIAAKKKNLSIALVAPIRIKELNRRYRKKNRPTDVLSFQDTDTFGEILICPAEVERNARKSNSNFKKELSRVLIHGILHLLGYDHKKNEEEDIMKKKEEYYLNI